jgi:KaiC/GvpD/RAD55 family RecA-like ATPase
MAEPSWMDSIVPTSPAPLKKKTEEEKAASKDKAASVGGKRELPKQYKLSFGDVKPIQRIKSSLFETGYARGTFIGVVGPPGTGKTRLMLQECIEASKRGEASLYLYNEFIRPKFDQLIQKTCNDMNISEQDLSNITFCDMSSADLKTADYDSINHFTKRMWAQQASYWLDNIKGDPSFVIVDSFSAIARRYIPQCWLAHANLLEHLATIYSERKVSPVTFLIHQKSQSSREVNNDSTVGGYGVVHELDVVMVLRMRDVDRWDSDRYGFKEGSMAHSVMFTKDRYGDMFEERMIRLENGKLTLADKLDDLVSKRKEQKLAEKSKYSKQSSTETEVVGADDVIWG